MLCFYGYGLFTQFVPSSLLAHKIEKARNAYKHVRGETWAMGPGGELTIE